MQVSRISAALALCLALCTVQALAARSLAQQKDLRAAMDKCLLTPEMLAGADYSGIKKGCDSKLTTEQRCESCTCALVGSLVTTLEGAGYKVRGQNITQADATNAISLCLDVVLPALTAAGVDVNSLAELAACGTAPACLTQFQ